MGKTNKHKKENTFRFQTFSERIANVNIDVIHQIRHHDDSPEDKGTYFGEALDRHSELNLTDHFTAFRREIVDQVQTFEQLVHHEAKIVAALKKHLMVPGSMAIPDILDLVVHLARDLQSQFYEYFRDFFDILIKLLDVKTQNVEILESTFTCLSYLFKFLWRYLVKDINVVYSYFSALLGGHYKDYVRNFAAESFAFLMRKVKDQEALFDSLFSNLEEEPDKCSGLGRLLFEMMKGVKGQFHSCMRKVLPSLLERLGPKGQHKAKKFPWHQVEETMATTILSMADHATKDTISEVWEILRESVSLCYEEIIQIKKRNKNIAPAAETLERLLRLCHGLAEYKNGAMIHKPDALGEQLTKMLKGPSLLKPVGQGLLSLTSTLLVTSCNKMEVQTTSKLVPAVFKTSYPTSMVYSFTRTLFHLPLFEKDVLPSLLPYCQANVAMGTKMSDPTVLLVTQLLLYKCPPVSNGSQFEGADTYMLDFGSSKKTVSFPNVIVQLLDCEWGTDQTQLVSLWCALVCLPHIRPLSNTSAVIKKVGQMIMTSIENPENDQEQNSSYMFVLSQALVTLVMMLRNEEVFQHVPLEKMLQFLKQHSSSVHALRMVDIYLTHAQSEHVTESLTKELFMDIFPCLQDNLSSPHSKVRLLTLRILASFDLPLPATVGDVFDVFSICECAETTAATVQDYRDKLRHLQKLEHAHIQNSIPLASLQQVPLRYLLGCLFINFSLLWQPIRELIASHAQKMGKDAFWDVYGSHLEQAADGAEEMLLKGRQLDEDTDRSEDEDTSAVFIRTQREHSLDLSTVDYTNFRLQLWTAMSEFPDQCQAKSRVYVPLLFRFLINEYYITDLSVAPTQNLLKQSRASKLLSAADSNSALDDNKDEPESGAVKRALSDNDLEKFAKRTKTINKSENLDENLGDGRTRIRTRSRSSISETGNVDERTSESDGNENIRTRSHFEVCTKLKSGNLSDIQGAGKRRRKRSGTSLCECDVMVVEKGSPESHRQSGETRAGTEIKRVRTRSNSRSEDGSQLAKGTGHQGKVGTRMRTRSHGEISDIGSDQEDMDVEHIEDKAKSNVKRNTKHDNENNTTVERNLHSSKVKRHKSPLKKGKGKKRLSVVDEKGENDKDEQVKVEKTEGVIEKENFDKKRKAATSALLAHLQVLAKLRDPKSLYMEPKLKELYFDLLVHKNVGVQKMAFQCIMTYKLKYLTPYRENFERLLDDATFKNEIVLFSVDHENTIINSEHRAELLPVLMRILFGKMFVKTGRGTSGKQHSGMRQSIVFRFLNGCKPDELKAFVDLVFAPFQHFLTDNPLKMVQGIRENIDLTRVLPISRIVGALNSYNMIFKKLGHLMDQYLPQLIQMIMGMASLAHECLRHREKLAPFVITQLKSIRQESVHRIIQVFVDYDLYEWSPVEIDAIFEAIVWPQLKSLPTEGLHSPTPLLRFLHCLTKNPRYFLLLSKHHPDNVELCPLPYVMQLLVHHAVSQGVSAFIMDMVHNLLQQREDNQFEAMEDGEEGEKVKLIEVNNMIDLAVDKNIKDTEIGTRLLLPHIQSILVHIERTVTNMQSKNRKPDKELDILSRISVFVRDEKICSSLISLLLPFLGKKISVSQKIEEDILTSLLNLLKLFADCSHFYMPICELFATLNNRNSRNILCDIFWIVCKQDESLRNTAAIIRKLNSWDRKRMDEPDYMLRLEGFRMANSLVKEMASLDTNICMALIHNSCYFIGHIEDMSIRDSSTHCLVTIIKQFGEIQYDESAYGKLIRNGLLVEVRLGLRSKTESVRHEFIAVLTAIIDIFGDQSAFSSMKLLRDADPEADFYENIRHIQMHKRTRALRRLIKFLLTNCLSTNALLSYFLPVVSSFLCEETYKKHSGLVDVAVDAVGVICRQLPWKHYLHILKHYLQQLYKKITNQKQLVKMIVAVLDAFHFDLSNSKFNMKLNPKLSMEEEKGSDTKQADKHEVKEETEVAIFEEDDELEKPVPEINEATAEDEQNVDISSGKQICSDTMATKIHETIVKNLMGQLNKVLTQKIRSEQEHKLVRKHYAEDDEILRVPIALAMVKMLQNLPQGALERYLPGILLKVCNFLKSRANDIRNTSRDTLILIQSTLGPRFFPFILSELKGLLKRGYQRHVLCYTLHSLLLNMADTVKPGDIDVCLASLQEVFNEEIFGEVAEEKEVEGIVAKVFEARSSKSYDSYMLIAKFIGRQSLLNFMKPLKQILETTHSHKSAKKVQEVLKHVITGLMENKDLTVETLLVFVHGLVSETLPLIKEQKKEKAPKKQEPEGRKPESCLILPEEAPRGGLKPKTSRKTNQHVLIEFGLQLLNMCLKKGKIVSTDKAHLQMLDPLIPHLASCLYSKYVKVNADCLRVLCWILRFDLPSIEKKAKKLANGMFILLRNYASAGAAKGDNKELVSMAFKAVTVLVRDVKHHKLNNDQLNVLLTFCEEDLHDYTRQSTAFSLLKAILSRKLNVPELHELMKKVQEMSITSDAPHVQRQCRQVMLQYLLDYPLGKKVKSHLEFYVSQLSYELENGRESALEMLAAFFTAFPQEMLFEYSGLFFIPMSANLVNDNSAKCRKLTALAIKSLLEKLDLDHRTGLFKIALKWFTDSKLRHRVLASQLCGLFVEVEGAKFEQRLEEVLPLLEQQLVPGKYEEKQGQSGEHDADHMIYNTLNTMMKILRECPDLITSSKWTSSMNILWDYVHYYLTYPHVWVQLTASQLFGLLFAAWEPNQLITTETKPSNQYLATDTNKKLRQLTFDLMTQFQSEFLTDDIAVQIIKNMVFIGKCAKLMEEQPQFEPQPQNPDEQTEKRLSLQWLVRKMAREAHHEAIHQMKSSLKRKNVFKWMASVCLDLGASLSESILRTMLPPLQREINDQLTSQDPDLKTLAQEVVDMVKKTVGIDKFTEVYASSQRYRTAKKEERKASRALMAVSNPEAYAKRKIKKNLAKKESKKRKIESFRPSKKLLKKKHEKFDLKD